MKKLENENNVQIQDKRYDSVIIGNTLGAYIFSLTLSLKEKKVLLVSPPRSSESEELTWSKELGFFSLSLMKYWGKLYGILPLENIYQYTLERPSFLIGKEHQVLLGSSAENNLRELYRKYGHWLPAFEGKLEEQLLNYDFEKTCFELLEKLHKEKKRGKNLFDVKKMLESFPPIFKKIFDLFSDSHALEKNKELEELIHLAQASFNFSLERKMNDWQCFCLILDLICPRYYLLEEKLLKDLNQQYQSPLFYKSFSSILDYQIDKQKLHSIQLDSFEGLVYGQNFYFLMPSPLRPFSFEEEALAKNEIFSASSFEIKSSEFKNKFLAFKNFRFLISPYDQIGTEHPLREYTFDERGQCLARILRPQGVGIKQEFYLSKTEELIKQDLSLYLFHSEARDDKSLSIKIKDQRPINDRDIWVRPKYLMEKGTSKEEKRVYLRPFSFFSKNKEKEEEHFQSCCLRDGLGEFSHNVYYRGPLIKSQDLWGFTGHLLQSFLFS